MNRKRIFFSVALIACIVPALILALASVKNTGEISLENHASEPIAQAMVVVCGQRLDFSEIPVGEIKTRKFKVGADSSYEVSVAFQSGRKIAARMGYVTRGANFEDKFVVTDSEAVFEAGP